MNKEVNYVLQGFLLTFVVIGAFQFSSLLLSIKPPPEEPDKFIGYCGNAVMVPPSDQVAVIKGKDIFGDNCASCHALRKDLTGPALAGVQERVPDKKLLYKWIRNPSAVLKSGNVYFNKLAKRYDNLVMTPFSDLSDEEINAVLAYIDYYGK